MLYNNFVWEQSRNEEIPNTSVQTDSVHTSSSELEIISSAFSESATIPRVYTCDGANVNPPLSFLNIPANTVSLALTMDDPDVPKTLVPDGIFDHWVVFNIPPTTTAIEASKIFGTEGSNGAGKLGYTGPCPPNGEHRYFFKLYALDKQLELNRGASKKEILDALKNHVIAIAQLMGRYNRGK